MHWVEREEYFLPLEENQRSRWNQRYQKTKIIEIIQNPKTWCVSMGPLMGDNKQPDMGGGWPSRRNLIVCGSSGEWWRIGIGINGCAPPDTAWTVSMGHELTTYILYPHSKEIPGGLPMECHVNWLPGWGVTWEDYQSLQPTAEFYTPGCGGYNNYPELGHCSPPPVRSL